MANLAPMVEDQSLSPNSPKNAEFVRSMFNEVFASPAYDEAVIHRYFDPDYTQMVDGKLFDFEHFTTHLRAVKQQMKSMSFEFKTLVGFGDVVLSNHVVSGETIENRTGQVKVVAEFRIQNGKIQSCDELTRQLAGDPADGDIGSRR